jgi:hypothetical protein
MTTADLPEPLASLVAAFEFAYDGYAFLVQLGALPAPEAAGTPIP